MNIKYLHLHLVLQVPVIFGLILQTMYKNYNGTIWAGITSNSGIAAVVDDTSPQLGGALDGQNNNMSNIGTIDGANLQLDFGTL